MMVALFATVEHFQMEDFIVLNKNGISFFDKLLKALLATECGDGRIMLNTDFWKAKAVYEDTGGFSRY